MGAITAHKAKALAWMTPRKHDDAVRELRIALTLERALAAWADANNVAQVTRTAQALEVGEQKWVILQGDDGVHLLRIDDPTCIDPSMNPLPG